MEFHFASRNTEADFVENDINRPFKNETYGGRMRLNESFLSTIERSIEWMLWKRSVIDNYRTCHAEITAGKQKWNGVLDWNGEFVIKKGDKNIGKGLFSTRFTGMTSPENFVLKDAALKVYKDERDKIISRCFLK